jgi:hypothetical protein
MAFGQVMMQNGGRNGVSLTAGIRWLVGRDGKSIQKVHEDKTLKTSNNLKTQKIMKQLVKTSNVTMKNVGSNNRKVIKSLRTNQTSLTKGKGNIKQL